MRRSVAKNHYNICGQSVIKLKVTHNYAKQRFSVQISTLFTSYTRDLAITVAN